MYKDVYDDFFVKQGPTGISSVYESNLSRALDLRGGGEGIKKLVLTPRKFSITFDFKTNTSNGSQHELFYLNNIVRTLPHIIVELDSFPVRITGDKDGLTLSSDLHTTGFLFYLKLAAWIGQLWARKSCYTGPLYQYEETVNGIKRRLKE